MLPEVLLPAAIRDNALLQEACEAADLITVVGGGKASAAMAAALETALAPHIDKIEGIVNVPADTVRKLRKIKLHAARPAGSNYPTEAGIIGVDRMLDSVMIQKALHPIVICLLSGGGSALLPAPADGITLADKLAVTKLLHASGATIQEMNAVRKHLSKIKGGGIVQMLDDQAVLFSLIISDVVGDPLDVIASGPTAADPTTFQDALSVLDRYQLASQVPETVLDRLTEGAAGQIDETLKALPANCHNIILGNNRLALDAAAKCARWHGFEVLDLGSFIEGEARQVAVAVAGIVRSIREDNTPVAPPACILIGGETTVTLGSDPGKGGRNQEFVLAMLAKLGREQMKGVAILSGGTDGEDGPTDAAGAVADESTFCKIAKANLQIEKALQSHNAYPFFDSCDGLLRSGPTQTNVMDVRVILVA